MKTLFFNWITLLFIVIDDNFFLLSKAFLQNFRLTVRVIVFFGLPSLDLPILCQSFTLELSKLTFIEFERATAVFSNSLSDMLVGVPSVSKLLVLPYCSKELFLISNWITLSSKQLILSFNFKFSSCNRWTMTSFITKISSHSHFFFASLSLMPFKAPLKVPASFFPIFWTVIFQNYT